MKKLCFRVMVTVLLGTVVAGCDQSSAGRLQSTPTAVFYMPWTGGLYEVINGKLIEVKKAAPADDQVRSIPFTQTIPSVDPSGFPALVNGVLKIGGGFRKLKIDVVLGSSGQKSPSAEEKVKFATALRDSSGQLKALTLSMMDKDGFPASEDKTIPILGSNWTGLTDASNKVVTLEFTSREVSDPAEDRDVSTLSVKWSSVDPPPPPRAGYSPFPGFNPGVYAPPPSDAPPVQ